MGIDYHSYAVIGCEIPKDKLYLKTKKRLCEHATDEAKKYCSDCGQPVFCFEREERTIPLGGTGYVMAISTDDERRFVGLAVSTGDCELLTLSKPFEAIKAELRAILEPLDLWDEKSFGLWAVQYCSY